jgi:hypothetical protein
MKTVVVYTHSDYEDVWIPFLKGIQKYLLDFNIVFFINRESEKIPYPQLVYDENNSYTDRLKECLTKLESENFIFIHEDMIVYRYPNIRLINQYFDYVSKGYAKSIKLIPVGSQLFRWPEDSTLYLTEFSKFSIQPTVISKSFLLELIEEAGSMSIWDFESSIKFNERSFISMIGGEKKLGIFHYESLVFPYVATAIVKGKWNISEYPEILQEILDDCKIDKNLRGYI